MIISDRNKSVCMIKCDNVDCQHTWQGNYYLNKDKEHHICCSCRMKKVQSNIKRNDTLEEWKRNFIIKRSDNKDINYFLPKRAIIKMIIKCQECEKEFNSNAFQFHKRKDLLCSSCKSKTIEETKINEKIYRECTECKNIKEIKEFVKRERNLYRGICKECSKNIKKIKYQKNKRYINKSSREFSNSECLFRCKTVEKISIYEETRQNNEYLEVKCTYCGKWFIPTNYQVKKRLSCINGLGNGEGRLYCSDNCKNECPIFGKIKYYKGQEGYSSREVQPQLRQLVFERDNYKCQKCGKEESLHCHHIDPVKTNPIESADINNCITLCKDCHKEVHKKEGCRYGELSQCL